MEVLEKQGKTKDREYMGTVKEEVLDALQRRDSHNIFREDQSIQRRESQQRGERGERGEREEREQI